MRHILAPVLFILTACPAVLSQRDWPPCVDKCLTNNAVSSWCDGDEKGDDLDACTCQSFSGSILIQCITDCPVDEQEEYASVLPKSCRSTLLPDVDEDKVKEDKDNGDSKDGDDDGDDDDDSSNSDSDNTSSKAPEPSQTEDGNTEETDAAVAGAVPTLLAAAGLLAGLLV